jgi:hypothetical protein
MDEGETKQPRDPQGRFGSKLYRSPRGRMVPASGRNRAERDETRGLLIDLINTPLEVEEDFAQIQVEKNRRKKRDTRARVKGDAALKERRSKD